MKNTLAMKPMNKPFLSILLTRHMKMASNTNITPKTNPKMNPHRKSKKLPSKLLDEPLKALLLLLGNPELMMLGLVPAFLITAT